jgi:hypothetical protein
MVGPMKIPMKPNAITRPARTAASAGRASGGLQLIRMGLTIVSTALISTKPVGIVGVQ